MSVKYDVHAIANAKGTGDAQMYVQPVLQDSMTRKELEMQISRSTTLTPADMEAVFAAVGHEMCRQLSAGCRFRLPGVGYFAISAGLHLPEGREKVTAKYISVDNIRFRPEAALLRSVQAETRFERMDGTTRSQSYTEEDMVGKVKEYLQTHRFISRSVLETEFHLRRTTACQWLARLVKLRVLVKEGARNAPIYHAY